MNKVTALFPETDRMTDEQFAALTITEKQDWMKRDYSAPDTCTVNMDSFDAASVLEELRRMNRTAPENAYAALENGVYTVHAEVPGTELNEAAVLDGLRAAALRSALRRTGRRDAAFERPRLTATSSLRLRLRRCETRRTACSAKRWQILKSR